MKSTPPISASEMAQLVRSKRVSASELLELHLRQIERLNPKLNAFVHLEAERARIAARELDARLRRGAVNAPLCGVPVSIKSSVDVAGLRCEAGSWLRVGNVPSNDAPLVERLKSAGAIVLGVTNAPEMLMAYVTDNLLYGRTSNPWDLTRTAGGSSGGESAAIASGMSAAGIGSDGGGSIRVPAHFTGICGLKPTPGRVPATGHFPQCAGPWATMGVVGPMGRTVSDIRLMWQVLAGPDDGDPMAAPVALQVDEISVRGLRVGLLEADSPLADGETIAVVNAAAKALESEGLTIEPWKLADFDEALRVWHLLFCEAAGVMVQAATRAAHHELSPILRDFIAYFERQQPHTVESLLMGLMQRDRVRARVLHQMKPYAAVLAPVSSTPAFRHGEGGWGSSHPADYIRTMRCSQFANGLGLPALVVPAGKSKQGMPVGVQLIGRPYSEDVLLSLAAVIEAHHGFEWPPMAHAEGAIDVQS
jgi:Asp-tRNA(Asn)/Glu-tRNA(Gln) amidotransferase A subunit family amidase